MRGVVFPFIMFLLNLEEHITLYLDLVVNKTKSFPQLMSHGLKSNKLIPSC